MEQIVAGAFYLGMVTYSVAATLYFVDLARRDGSSVAVTWASRVLTLSVLLHAVHLVSASFLTNVCPVASLPFALSLTAVLMGGVFLAMRQKMRVGALGVAVAPLALCFLIGAQLMSGAGYDHTPPTALLALHIAANVLGFGLFLLAGAAGAFYLIQERQLKRKKLLLGGKLPPLDSLDSAEHRLLLAGFPLLTIGIVTGAFFLHGEIDVSRVIVAALAFATWLQVAAVLVLRTVWGWRGRRTAYGTLAGLACVALVMCIYLVRELGSTTL